jgi:anti-sigma B factor antagonist
VAEAFPVRDPSDRLKITRTTEGDRVLVALEGELDLETTPELDRQLAELEGTRFARLLIDLHGVEFMDSTGLAAIFRTQRYADANGHVLSLRRGSSQVQRLFELTGTLDRVTFED